MHLRKGLLYICVPQQGDLDSTHLHRPYAFSGKVGHVWSNATVYHCEQYELEARAMERQMYLYMSIYTAQQLSDQVSARCGH